MSNKKLTDVMSMIAQKEQKEEISYGEVAGIGTSFVSVKIKGAKTSTKIGKPPNFQGQVGDSVSISRSPKTRLWEILEVRKNSSSIGVSSYNPAYVVVKDWTNFPSALTLDIPFSLIPAQYNNVIIEIENPRTVNASGTNRNVTFSGYDGASATIGSLTLTLAAMYSTETWVGFIRVESFNFRLSGSGKQNMNEVVYSNRTVGSEVVRASNRFNGSVNTFVGWRFAVAVNNWDTNSRYRIVAY